MKKIEKKTLLQIGAVRGQWAVPVSGVHHPDHHTWHLAQCPGWDHESDDDDQMIMMWWQSPAPASWGPRACTCRWAPPSTSPASSGTRQSSPPRWESSWPSRCHAPPSRVTCQYPSSQPDNENNRQRPTAIVWMSDVFAVIVSKMCTFINGRWSAQGGILSTSGSDL